MPIESYVGQLDPDGDPEIWRFFPLNRFEDMIANDELFFNRADRFPQDDNEGIPPEDYLRKVFNLRRYDIADEKTLIHHTGVFAQDREAFYVTCWHLARTEQQAMWRDFGNGVAIVSRYGMLKTVLDAQLDRTYLGLVRYGEFKR
jgi:hypothetical protein